jgi:LysM repeat protein
MRNSRLEATASCALSASLPGRRPARSPRSRLPSLALVAALISLPLVSLAQQGSGAINAERPEYYVIKKGDTLGGIAKRYGLDARDLAAWNGVADPRRIDVGQRLRLSSPKSRVADAGSSAQPAAGVQAQTASPSIAAAGPAARTGVVQSPTNQQQELERLRATTGTLIQLLLSQGVITRDKAEELMQQAQLGPLAAGVGVAPPSGKPGEQGAPAKPGEEAAQGPKSEAGVVRVPYVPQVVKDQIRDQVKEEVIAEAKAEGWGKQSRLPEWLERLTWKGDLRLRYQGNYYGDGNVPAPIYNEITGADQTNTTENESLWVYRARLGFLARLSDTWSTEFRITSGNSLNPVSTNQSLGDYFNRGLITLDLAYLQWAPNERWRVAGGRIPNPYFSTTMVWDEDLSFSGFAGTYKPQFSRDLRGFFTGGAFLVDYEQSDPVTPNPKTKYLFGLQAGADWNVADQAKLTFGLAYYDYQNTWGIRNPSPGSQIYDWTVPAFNQKGNTLFNINSISNPGNPLYALASKFQVLNLTAKADLAYFDPVVISVIGDYANNIGFNQQEIFNRTGLQLQPATSAYQLGLTVGRPGVDQFGNWEAFFRYRYVQGNSVFAAFNDSDFHLGGTNAKGYIVGGSFVVHPNVWLLARWLSAEEIDGPPLSIDVLQIDLNAKF